MKIQKISKVLVVSLIVCLCCSLLISCGKRQYFELDGVEVDPAYIKNVSKVKKDNPSLYHDLSYGVDHEGTLVGKIVDFTYSDFLSERFGGVHYEMIVSVNGEELYFKLSAPKEDVAKIETINDIDWIGKTVYMDIYVSYPVDGAPGGETTEFEKRCGIIKGKARLSVWPQGGIEGIKFI